MTPLFQEIWFLGEVLYFEDPRVKLTQSYIVKACNDFQYEGLKDILFVNSFSLLFLRAWVLRLKICVHYMVFLIM